MWKGDWFFSVFWLYIVLKKKMNIKLSFPHWLCKRIVQNLHAAKPEATVILSRAYEAVFCSLKKHSCNWEFCVSANLSNSDK